MLSDGLFSINSTSGKSDADATYQEFTKKKWVAIKRNSEMIKMLSNQFAAFTQFKVDVNIFKTRCTSL